MGRLSPTPLNELTPQQARLQPLFRDAVNSLLGKNKIPRPTANGTVSQRMISGAAGTPIRIVVYIPNNVAGPMPVAWTSDNQTTICLPTVYSGALLAQ